MNAFPFVAFAAFVAAASPAPARVSTVAPVAGPKDVHHILRRAAEADGNHDGFITRAEWLAYRADQFLRIDRNGDGFLTLDDAPPLVGRARLEEMQSLLDADHDGRVSRSEFIHGPAPVFDRADVDHNGVIDPQELKQAGVER